MVGNLGQNYVRKATAAAKKTALEKARSVDPTFRVQCLGRVRKQALTGLNIQGFGARPRVELRVFDCAL